MIGGTIDENNGAFVSLCLRGMKSELEVEAMLDTGFDGFICLPIALAVPLGLELFDTVKIELADGTIMEDELVFSGQALWRGEYVDVEVVLTRSDGVLVGTALLEDSKVILDYKAKTVSIEA